MKTILVTGSSRGIGAEIIRCAFKSGEYNVVINYNKSYSRATQLREELIAYAAENPDKAFGEIAVIKADVSEETEVLSMFDVAEKQFGKIDVLVNNAAISSFSLFTDITYEDWNNIMSVNVGSVFLCTKRALKSMIHEKCGRIINISSIWGICGSSCEAHYSASKAAVIGLTKALAKEVGPSGITVNCVAPGVIDTEMNKNLTPDAVSALCEETPLGRIGTPLEIAKAVLFLASDDAGFITGQTISPNGGIVI